MKVSEIVTILITLFGMVGTVGASIAAWRTVIVSSKRDRESNNEKQYSVQPWFHVTRMSRMGEGAPIQLIVLNDASPSVKIEKVELEMPDQYENINLDFKYLKKDDTFVETGKCFAFLIENNNEYFGRKGILNIYYTNLYNKSMKASSPEFNFVRKENQYTLLEIENNKFLYVPFSNIVIEQ
ncbi:hypothetical protein [Rossellomorea sp. BNER]|uniref:hypothetical protein n=1 Tax=Rossellomorea sp. BNER TaxID=2962031 RepID=UPI003AF2BDB2|nr:hypothetical protein [Rossellomorea sp. BNER]